MKIEMIEQYLTSEQQQQQHPTRRSRMETMCDILVTIAAGTEKPTHIMYKANLSWRIMQQYMRALETQGLVVAQDDEGKRVYHLTEKGFKLLEQFNSLKEGLLLQ